MTTTRRLPFKQLIAAAALAVSCGAHAAQTNLLETGSTLLYPLFNLWVPAYTQANPDVKITTQGTGSGTGIAQAISGVAQIGASDAYMSDAQMKQNPNIVNIPLAISAQTVNYNLPGLNGTHLKLDGPVLAGIYDGSIKNWNDAKIAALNPGVQLPDHPIVTIHRADGSGDTFIFTQYLAFTTPAWKNAAGYGTSVSWPAVQGAVGANGNPGMVQAAQQTPYSIAYIGVSFHQQIDEAGLGTAMLKNHSGKYLLPTTATVNAAAAAMAAKTPKDERLSLIFAPGENSYPIVNYEYAIVNTHQANAAAASALKQFLNWSISATGGNSDQYLNAVRFVPLPSKIADLSRDQILKIQ